MSTSKTYNFIFKDEKIREIVDIFLKKAKGTFHNFNIQDASKVVDLLPLDLDIYSITWEFFQELFNKSIDEKTKDGACRLITEFIKNDCYYGNYLETVETFKEVFLILGKELYWLFSNSLLPYNLIVIKGDSKSKNAGIKDRTLCYKNDSSNLYLTNLLKDFAIQNITGSRLKYQFYGKFQTSLNGKLITKITDFNSETFKQQYYFYKENENSTHSLTLLKKFYLKQLNHPDGKNILHWREGIDGNMLRAVSFNKNYEMGFIPIPLNPFDPIPKFDKWLVMPNGAEKKTTKINSFSYKPIDFSLIEIEDLKNGLKDWFWNSNVVITARIDYAHICIRFINFIFNLRNELSIRRMTSTTNVIDNITVEEAFSYVQFIKTNNKSPLHISAVRYFLAYLQENNLYKVEPTVFKYFVIKSKEVTSSTKDISDENLIKIEAKFKENAHDNYLNTLYYIIFHIAIATEFRISHIINLKVNCLKKGVKKDYYLESNTKVSKGKEVKVPITPYTRRYIETAIKFTQDVRDECKDNAIKEHIFIHNTSSFNFKVVTIRSFSDYLKRICLELGIEGYTAENLRDTYMTKAIEHAIKNNMSDMEIRALTIHKQISTTTNHYVSIKIKDYLEATHMVVIGNPTIKGNIIGETNHKNEDLVNDQCGYCPYESCIKKNDNLDCLMCSGFIATIDRIPFYEEKIQSIENEIKSTKLPSEKDRLVTIKRLYLAYLGKLLELKESTG
ncbi:site-specific integrase [Psychrobacillus sp. MER TA 171]|uniref:site-specific integrase n=1 Tax=Psychrobacillus sp. MER TA 171 TaxID=2939577 RepID=UPI00203B01F4|nr:site-specific integrase [Psychrobacillus sp. MER TA 171]MCM3359530.1 site-specific integrase [Psychrobacillus sp. MER TA 171]